MSKKKIIVPVVLVEQEPQGIWDKIKVFFKRSESIFLTWLGGAISVVTSIIGYFDMSPLFTLFQTSTDFNNKQLIGLGIGGLIAAISLYFARIRNTKEVGGQLLPKA